MKKIKILFIIPDFSNCGPNNMCSALIKYLNKDTYDIHVIGLGVGELLNEFNKTSKTYVFSRRDILGVRKFVKSESFSLIHSHTIIGDLFSYLAGSSSLKVTTIHNYPFVDSVYRRGKIVGSLLAFAQSYAIRKMFKVACSNSVMKYCKDTMKFNDLYAIDNGVQPFECNQSSIMEKKRNKLDFFYLGSLNQRKNVEYLLTGFLKWENSKYCNLHILGDGPLRCELNDKFSRENIFFYGKVSEPRKYIVNYDCFVSASLAEGMPLALLESMSAGKSFICSDIMPHTEVFNKMNAPGGFIFSCNDNHLSLLKAFEQFYGSLNKDEMSHATVRLFNEYYTSQRMSNEYSDFYQIILNGNNNEK
ncbi:TPA: glycosyltransferase family 4 protein [Raoultella ornithinolytica]|nr:glycosyltransferase family 4 protein [Raoultella ornithinolytica]